MLYLDINGNFPVEIDWFEIDLAIAKEKKKIKKAKKQEVVLKSENDYYITPFGILNVNTTTKAKWL